MKRFGLFAVLVSWGWCIGGVIQNAAALRGCRVRWLVPCTCAFTHRFIWGFGAHKHWTACRNSHLKSPSETLETSFVLLFFPTTLLLSGQKKKKKSSNGKKCVQKQAFSKIADVCYINVVLLVKAKQFCIISRWASAEQDDCTSVETFGKGFFCITFLTTINPQTACKQIYERFQSL